MDTMPDEAGVFLFTGTDANQAHVGLFTGGGAVVGASGRSQGVVRGGLYSVAWTDCG
mgnify:CR=1 FL=1